MGRERKSLEVERRRIKRNKAEDQKYGICEGRKKEMNLREMKKKL